MTAQLSLFDLLRAPPITRPVDPDGGVVQGDPHETLVLPHPKLAWHLARIELHRHDDGLWMWSVSGPGGSYKVGPKWGRFAVSRDDALFRATQELLAAVRKVRDPGSVGITAAQLQRIADWAARLAHYVPAPGGGDAA